MAEFVDYYDLLGVSTDATTAQLRTAFLDLVKQHHPDTGGSTEHMLEINLAYATLKEAKSRRAYDLIHSFQTGTSTVRYREIATATDESSLSGLSDEEIEDYMNTIFAEYATKSTKARLHKKHRQPFSFRRRKPAKE